MNGERTERGGGGGGGANTRKSCRRPGFWYADICVAGTHADVSPALVVIYGHNVLVSCAPPPSPLFSPIGTKAGKTSAGRNAELCRSFLGALLASHGISFFVHPLPCFHARASNPNPYLRPLHIFHPRGYDPETNKSGDIIYANTPILDKGDGVGVQYFWEAFPAGSGPGDR